MGMESFERHNNIESSKKYSKDNMQEIVERVMDIHRLAAAKFLPAGELRDQIIKSHSDPQKLTEELTYYFRNKTDDEVNEWMEQGEILTNNEDYYVKFAHEKNFATNQEERALFESTGRYTADTQSK